MEKTNRNNKLFIIAIIFSIIAVGSASEISNYLSNITCYNCTLDNPNFVNYSFNVSNISQDLLNLKVNKSGDIMSGDLNFNGNNIVNLDIISNTGTPLLISSVDSIVSTKSANIVYSYLSPLLQLSVINTNIPESNFINIYTSKTYFGKDIDMLSNNLTNCKNCINTSNLNISVDKNLSNYSNMQNWISNNSDINMSNHNITNISQVLALVFSAKSNERIAPYSTSNVFTAVSNTTNAFDIRVSNSGAYYITNFLGGYRSGGTTMTPLATTAGQALFWLYGSGHSGSSWIESSQVDIRFYADYSWSPTNRATRIDFTTTPNNSVTATHALRIANNSNIEIIQNGKGITMHSPNGNIFCTTVSNLGVLTTVSGACI